MSQQLITAETVYDVLSDALVDTLRVERSAIAPSSSIVADLGAESLDFLDINYRLEQTFGIRIARHFFLEHAEELYGEGTVIDDKGRLTSRAVPLFEHRYGAHEEVRAGMDMDEVPALITVQSMVDGVLSILHSLPEQCACGSEGWTVRDGTMIVCGACAQPASFVDGDELTRQWLRQVDAETGVLSGPWPE
jgi:acyl carrier protein